MYELKRSKLIEEEVKIGDEIIKTELNLTENSQNIIKLLRGLEVLQIKLEKKENLEENLKELGEKMVELTKMIFGSNFEKVLRFYSKDDAEIVTVDNACINEMIYEVLPFVLHLRPKIEEYLKERKTDINKAIKGKRVE